MNLGDLKKISKEFGDKKQFLKRPDIFVSICLATAQAICWGKEGISLIELGVRHGSGLSFIVKIAEHLTDKIGMKYHIYGFDTFGGMPDLVGSEDHHEIWSKGQFKPKHTYDEMVELFKGKATLIKGDVKDTVGKFLVDQLDINYPIGFISLDLDLYSSTRSGLKVLEDVNYNKYIPAVTMIADNQDYLITYNDWCGEGLAIKEFNEDNKFRKIQAKREIYEMFRCAHILDHGLRTGKEDAKQPFEIDIRKFIEFTERAMV